MEWVPQERRIIGHPSKTWMEEEQATITTRNLEKEKNIDEWCSVSRQL